MVMTGGTRLSPARSAPSGRLPPASPAASFTGSAAAKARELEELNVNVIIQRVDANEEEEENENKNNNESNWVNEDEVM